MYVIRDELAHLNLYNYTIPKIIQVFMLKKVGSGLVEFSDFQYYLDALQAEEYSKYGKKMSRFKITEIQQYLGEKSRDALISMDEEADSLLKFIDKENKLLHKHFVHQDHQEQPSLIIQSIVLVL
jgi:hypothetical protein